MGQCFGTELTLTLLQPHPTVGRGHRSDLSALIHMSKIMSQRQLTLSPVQSLQHCC